MILLHDLMSKQKSSTNTGTVLYKAASGVGLALDLLIVSIDTVVFEK